MNRDDNKFASTIKGYAKTVYHEDGQDISNALRTAITALEDALRENGEIGDEGNVLLIDDAEKIQDMIRELKGMEAGGE